MTLPLLFRLFGTLRYPLLLLCGLLSIPELALFAAETAQLSEDDIRWREKIGFNPQVHGGGAQRADRDFFPKLPFAYYPSANELEVVFDLAFAKLLLPAGSPPVKEPVAVVDVQVIPARIEPAQREKAPFYYGPEQTGAVQTDRPVATFKLPLDDKGRGIGRFTLPKLEPGNYRVEYAFGGVSLRAAKTFRRTFFEWETNSLGLDHKVYPPFEPVRVSGASVTVVDRTYTVNPQGLFESVVSKGRELLAEPMRLVVELESGEEVAWKAGPSAGGVKGQVVHPDTAVFETQAHAAGLGLDGAITVEEDGCARVRMQLGPVSAGGPGVAIKKAWLRIAVKEKEAPLCHMVGLNSMRHNYAGRVPRGGKITWINQTWRPARFEVAAFGSPAPDSYEVWDGRQQMHWGGEFWNFTPYVWLGAEERGLAWFGNDIGGYETDGERGIQRLRIEPGKVVLHVELLQKPVRLTETRTFEFGLQASPTKPMQPGWRGYAVPGGGGMSVVVWGGFNCADKVPANRDWTIVDKVMEGARTGKADYAWFADYAKQHTTLVNEGGGAKPGTFRQVPLEQAKANGQPWLTALNHFASNAAVLGTDKGITVYFEEHQTSGVYPDVAEFQDEWADNSFSRYRMFDYPFTWGPEVRSANAASYRDFAVFYANEWMRRGVGIYYDNTYPMTDSNRHRLQDRGLGWQNCIWGHRDYYRRVWKRSRELMQSGQVTRPLHTVGHVTNCQVLPYTTWWDATLGVESPGQWQPDTVPPRSPEEQKRIDKRGYVVLGGPSKDNPGRALPYPPDYLRAMEMGRMAGVISHSRHSLRSDDAFGGLGVGYGSTDKPPPDVMHHRRLSDKAMNMVHEIRGGGSPHDHDGIRTIASAFNLFGYGSPTTTVHNYWDEEPFLKGVNPAIKWIALERPSAAKGEPVLALLQSYDAEACSTTLNLPEGTALLDLFTRQLTPADEPLHFAADYGTRLVLIGDRGRLAPLAWAEAVVMRGDFELGLPPGWKSRGTAAPAIVADPQDSANQVLRIMPAHPSQHSVGGKTAGDYSLSLRFRLPALTTKPPYPQFYGVLQMLHRQIGDWPKQSGQALQLGIQNGKDGKPALALTYATRRAGTIEPFNGITTDRLAETGALIPLDDAWHTLSVTVAGKRHTLAIDDVTLFDGETDVTDGGALVIGPGWADWSPGFVDIDELVVRR